MSSVDFRLIPTLPSVKVTILVVVWSGSCRRPDKAGDFLFHLVLIHQDLHGLIERFSLNKHKEIDGIAVYVFLRPSPIMLFYDEVGIILDKEVVVFERTEPEPQPAEERRKLDFSGLTNLGF